MGLHLFSCSPDLTGLLSDVPYSRRCCYSLKAPRSVDLSTLLFCCPPMHLSQLGSFGKSIYTGAMVYFLFSFSGLWDPITAKLLGEGGGGCRRRRKKKKDSLAFSVVL